MFWELTVQIDGEGIKAEINCSPSVLGWRLRPISHGCSQAVAVWFTGEKPRAPGLIGAATKVVFSGRKTISWILHIYMCAKIALNLTIFHFFDLLYNILWLITMFSTCFWQRAGTWYEFIALISQSYATVPELGPPWLRWYLARRSRMIPAK